MKNKYLTKPEVIRIFKEEFKNQLNSKFKTDKPAKREAWNDFCDSLEKDGQIRPNTDWTQPAFIQS